MKRNILLIGFMGTGKSTISRQLGKNTGMKEIDLDAYIVEKAGKSINDIFAEEGEKAFRKMETASLRELAGVKNCIISCGGGTATREVNVPLMKALGQVVLLTATPETIYQRVRTSNDRPILNGNMNVEYIGELLAKRLPYYEKAADITVATDDKTVETIAYEIAERCRL